MLKLDSEAIEFPLPPILTTYLRRVNEQLFQEALAKSAPEIADTPISLLRWLMIFFIREYPEGSALPAVQDDLRDKLQVRPFSYQLSVRYVQFIANSEMLINAATGNLILEDLYRKYANSILYNKMCLHPRAHHMMMYCQRHLKHTKQLPDPIVQYGLRVHLLVDRLSIIGFIDKHTIFHLYQAVSAESEHSTEAHLHSTQP